MRPSLPLATLFQSSSTERAALPDARPSASRGGRDDFARALAAEDAAHRSARIDGRDALARQRERMLERAREQAVPGRDPVNAQARTERDPIRPAPEPPSRRDAVTAAAEARADREPAPSDSETESDQAGLVPGAVGPSHAGDRLGPAPNPVAPPVTPPVDAGGAPQPVVPLPPGPVGTGAGPATPPPTTLPGTSSVGTTSVGTPSTGTLLPGPVLPDPLLPDPLLPGPTGTGSGAPGGGGGLTGSTGANPASETAAAPGAGAPATPPVSQGLPTATMMESLSAAASARLAGEGAAGSGAAASGGSASSGLGGVPVDPAGLAQTGARMGAPEPSPSRLPDATPQRADAPVPLQALAIDIGMRAMRGAKEFQIKLDPEDLGKVDVTLSIAEDGAVQAKVIVEKVETLHLLQRDARTLERAFEQAGLKTSPDALSFGLGQNGQGRSGREQDREREGDRRDGPRAVAEDEARLALMPSAIVRRLAAAASGIDINI